MKIFWVLSTVVAHTLYHLNANAELKVSGDDDRSVDFTKESIDIPENLRRSLPTLLQVDNELISGDDFYKQTLQVYQFLEEYLPVVTLEKRLRILQHLAMRANENLITQNSIDDPTPGFIERLRKVEDLLNRFIQIVLPHMASVRTTNQEQLQLQMQMAKAMSMLITRGAEIVETFLKKRNHSQFFESMTDAPMDISPQTPKADVEQTAAAFWTSETDREDYEVHSESEPLAGDVNSAGDDVLRSILKSILDSAEKNDLSSEDHKYEFKYKRPAKKTKMHKAKAVTTTESHDSSLKAEHNSSSDEIPVLNDSAPLLPVNETLRALAISGSYGILLELSSEMTTDELKEARDLFDLSITYADRMVDPGNSRQKKLLNELKCLQHVYNQLILTKEDSDAVNEKAMDKQYDKLPSHNKLEVMETISGLLPLIEMLPGTHPIKNKILDSVRLLIQELDKIKPKNGKEQRVKNGIKLFLETYKENNDFNAMKVNQESKDNNSKEKTKVKERSSSENDDDIPKFDKTFLAKGKLVGMIVHFKRVDTRRSDSDVNTEWRLPNFMEMRRDDRDNKDDIDVEEAYILLNDMIGDSIRTHLRRMDTKKMDEKTKHKIKNLINHKLTKLLNSLHHDQDHLNSAITKILEKIKKSFDEGTISLVDFLSKLSAHKQKKTNSGSDSEPNSALIHEGTKSIEVPEKELNDKSDLSDNVNEAVLKKREISKKLGIKHRGNINFDNIGRVIKAKVGKLMQKDESYPKSGWRLQHHPPKRSRFAHHNAKKETNAKNVDIALQKNQTEPSVNQSNNHEIKINPTFANVNAVVQVPANDSNVPSVVVNNTGHKRSANINISANEIARKNDNEDLLDVLKSMYMENDDLIDDDNSVNGRSNKRSKRSIRKVQHSINENIDNESKTVWETPSVMFRRRDTNAIKDLDEEPEATAYEVLNKIMGEKLKKALKTFGTLSSINKEDQDKVKQIVEHKLQRTLNYLREAQAKNSLTRAALYEIGQKVYEGSLPVSRFLAGVYNRKKKGSPSIVKEKDSPSNPEQKLLVKTTTPRADSTTTEDKEVQKGIIPEAPSEYGAMPTAYIHKSNKKPGAKEKKLTALEKKILADTSVDQNSVAKSVRNTLQRMQENQMLRSKAFENKLLQHLLQNLHKDIDSEEPEAKELETKEVESVSPELISYIVVVKINLPEIKDDGLVSVDLSSIGDAMQVVPVGIIPADTKDKELKEMLDRVMGAIIESNSFKDLEEALKEEESFRMRDRILKSQYRRWAKPSRCNYNSKLAKVFGGTRWIVCQQPLTFEPSIYDRK